MDIIDDLLIRFDYNNEYIIPRRVIFVVDRSGSMNKIKWNKTILSLCYALKQLKYEYDKFGILLFDLYVEIVLHLQIVNDKNVTYCIQMLKDKYPNAGTDTNEALLYAINDKN